MDCPTLRYTLYLYVDDDDALKDGAIVGIAIGSVALIAGGYFAYTMLKAGNTLVGKPTGRVPSSAMHDG